MGTSLFVLIISIMLILWGLANGFFGYRFYRISLLVAIGILGAGYSFISLRESPNLVQILIPGLVALLFGLAAYYLRSLILSLAGGIILAIVAGTPAYVFSLSDTLAWILIRSKPYCSPGWPASASPNDRWIPAASPVPECLCYWER